MILPALMVKEYRTWLRSRMSFLVLTAVVFVLSGVTLVAIWGLAAGAGIVVPPIGSSSPPSATLPGLIARNRAVLLFLSVAWCSLLTLGVVAPAVAASAIGTERERQTLDVLVSTGLSPLAIVLGKAATAVSFVLVLAATALPAYAATWAFGGVGLNLILMTALVLTVSVVMLVAVGIFFSAWAPSSLVAALFAYCVTFFLGPGVVALYLIGSTSQSAEWLRFLLYLNPFLALASLPEPLAEQVASFFPATVKGLLVQRPLEIWGQAYRIPPWSGTLFLYSVGSLALLFGAAARVDPLRSRTPGRVRTED